MTITKNGDFCSLDKTSVLEPRVFFLIGCGIYLIGSVKGDKYNAQVASSLVQVSANPPKLIVSVNKESLTHEYILESKVFSVSVLSIDTPKKFIMLFGFRSGRSYDKFKEIKYKIGMSGAPVILENTIAYLDCQVIGSYDCDTHTVFFGKIIDAELLKTDKPMSFEYYIEEMRGKVPTTAPSYSCAC